jgi:hypothetical protein
MTAIDKMTRHKRIELYRTFDPVDSSRAMAGLPYESQGHILLREGVALTLKIMEMEKARTRYHWKTRNPDSEIVIFPPNPSKIYGEVESVLPIEPNHLHVPSARNQAAFDSFFQLGAIIYFFQFTVSKTHDIKEFLSGQLHKLPSKKNWRFVFITPPGCEVDVTADSTVNDFLKGVKVYSVHLKIDQQPNALGTATE